MVDNPGDAIGEHLATIGQAGQRGSFSKEMMAEAEMLLRVIKRSRSIVSEDTGELGRQRKLIDPVSDFNIGLLRRHVTDDELKEFCPEVRIDGRVSPRYYSMVQPKDLDVIDTKRLKIIEDIKRLVSKGANVICMNELGYPAFKIPEDDPSLQQELEQKDRWFRSEIQRISDESDVIVICGSYHDVHDLTNKAVIFAPEATAAHEHQKLTTAKSPSIREVIRLPDNKKMFLYETAIGRLGILVCLDAYDLNVFCRHILIGQTKQNRLPDLIVVPAWSEKKLTEACQDLSYFARSVVVYVNGAMSYPHAAIYAGGRELQKFEELESAVFKVSAQDRSDAYELAKANQRKGLFGSVTGTHI